MQPIVGMQSNHGPLNENQEKVLQRVIKEDSLSHFRDLLSTIATEKAQLYTFESAVKQNAQAITHTISQYLKDRFLILAARHGSQYVAEFLTQPHIYQYSSVTETAFYDALKKKHFKIAELFLNRGTDINQLTYDVFDEELSDLCKEETKKKTLLHHLVYRGDEEDIPTMRWLLAHGADPDKPSTDGDHPLHDIVWDEFGTVELLCDHGADPNARNSKGNTSLMTCITSGGTWNHQESKAVIEIITAGADLDAQNSEGDTALHLAVQEDNPCTALILLHYGASKEICDNKQRTPYAFLQERLKCRSTAIKHNWTNVDELKALLSNPVLPPLPQIAMAAQEAIRKKKVKLL